MAGTIDGGKQAAKTIKEKYGDDFYIIAGAKGGKWRTSDNGVLKGFARNRELASEAGRRGGRNSRKKNA